MIPTLIFVGLALGLLVHDRLSFRRSVVVGAVASLVFGVAIGVGDSSMAAAGGATALALANAVVGGAVGVGLGMAVRMVWRASRRPTS